MNLWPHQSTSIRSVHEAIADGHRRVCLTIPTGGGKTRVACELVRDWLVAGFRVSLYTNRKMLVEQLSEVLKKFGLHHGIRAAGHDDDREHPLQISSVQTEASRVLKRRTWQLHQAERVLLDECHINSGDMAQQLMAKHLEIGGSFVGLTATPLGIGHMFDHLIVGATNSELRRCGALIPAIHYGPDEPDTKSIKKDTWELTEKDIRRIMKVQFVWGRVLHWFNLLNPEHKPTILFAPGVAESVWFAEEFTKHGIPAAHIDGEKCWYKGEFHESHKEVRKEILAKSKSGEITVLCNRFVLREGIDCPWLAHGIFATIFGSLQSYLQSGGRLLRSHPGMETVTIQDHGGNWWRHGNINADRVWELGDTEAKVQGRRADRLRDKPETSPARCPQCGKILATMKCSCGFSFTKRSRPVIGIDGTIREHTGNFYQPRRIAQDPTLQELWKKMYFRSRTAGRTFRAAAALFAKENNWQYPNPDWPFYPRNQDDMYRKVNDVPREELQ